MTRFQRILLHQPKNHFERLMIDKFHGGGGEIIQEVSGIPPLMLPDSVGKPLQYYEISGATVQDGEPTPESPVLVQGVGEKTENLIEGFIQGANISSDGRIHDLQSDYKLAIVKIVSGETYTINASHIVSNVNYQVYAFFKSYPKIGDVSFDNSRIVPLPNRNIVVTAPPDAEINYMCVRYVDRDPNPQVSLGSTALPYEPYGYKIPILCSGCNLIPYTNSGRTISGVTFTKNDDGTFIANGTAEEKINFTVCNNGVVNFKKGKTYKLVGCPKGGSLTTFNFNVWGNKAVDTGDGVVFNEKNLDVQYRYLYFFIAKGYTCDNLLFKPMVTENTALTYDDYAPYTSPIEAILYSNRPLYSGDKLIYPANKRINADGTEEIIELPEIPTLQGNNVLSVETEVQPENVAVKYYKQK